MDGTDADGEWSDGSDDGVKSGSATAVSDGEADDSPPLINKKGIESKTTAITSTDPVHAILDKIDAELGAITQSQKSYSPVTTSPKKVTVSRLLRIHQVHEGPQIAVLDKEENISEKKGKTLSTVHGGSDKDTGLGTGSIQEDPGSDKEHKRIMGSAQMYSDVADMADTPTDDDTAAKKVEDHHSDLDSLAAQQIDEKFKQIMRKKRGGYFNELKTGSHMSDQETVKTEDFEDRFKESLVGSRGTGPADLPPHPRSVSAASRTVKTTSSVRPTGGYGSDWESVKTEDFETRFQDLIVKQNSSGVGSKFSTQGSKGKHGSGKDVQSKVKELSSNNFTYTKASTSDVGRDRSDRSVHNSLDHKSGQKTVKKPLLVTRLRDKETTPDKDVINLPRPRSVSPVRSRPEQKVVGVYEEDSVDEAAKEIERETARIRQEMERERRAKSASPTQHRRSPTASPVRTSLSPSHTPIMQRKQVQVQEDKDMMSNSFHRSSPDAEKQIVTQEIKTLRQALHASRLELRDAEKAIKDIREKSEDARTQLMLTEFKRTNAMKDLERVVDELSKKKKQVKSYENQIKVKLDEVREFESLGISKNEAKALMDENASLKMRCRNMEGLQLERDELVRQLELAKEELFSEQKQGRFQKEELQEEIENLVSKLEENQGNQVETEQKLHKLESSFRRMEREKNDVIQEKTKEYEEMRERVKKEQEDNRRHSVKEVEDLQQEIMELRHKVRQLQDEVSSKDDLELKLRDEVLELQQELAKENDARDAISEDHKRVLQNLRKETDSAIMQLRESLFLEKQQALEDLRAEIDQERRESSVRAEERLAALISENTNIVAEKNQDIEHLQDLVKRVEDDRRETEKRVQEEISQQVRDALDRERQVLETEKDWILRREKENLAAESKQRLNHLTGDLERERTLKDELLHQVKVLREELEDQRQQNRQATKEKVFAVARAKDMVREQTNTEVERIKEKLKQDNQREMEKLRENVKSLEEEIRQMRADKQHSSRQERESSSALERTERTVINEINEECRRSASLLGISPRRVQHGRNSPSPGGSLQTAKYRTPITTALANLRACNEELRTHIHEMRQELDSQKTLLAKLHKEKDETSDRIRREVERDKNSELENLKERLLREHIEEMNKSNMLYNRDKNMMSALCEKENELAQMQQNINRWKEETSEKLSRKFEMELNKELEKRQSQQMLAQRDMRQINDCQQQEIERLEREVQKLVMSQSKTLPSHSSPGGNDINTAKTLKQLQYKVKHLQSENNSLRRSKYLSYNYSVPDLTNSGYYRQSPAKTPITTTREHEYVVNSLGERVKSAEKDATLAEHHTQQNQAVLSQKMHEMSKLQNTLSNQTKELMQLERAYDQLHRQYNHRSPSPVARILSATR